MQAEAWEWTQRGRPYEEARDSFARWSARERPAEAVQILRDGRLIFKKETALAINQLVRAWRAAESCRIYHPSVNSSATRIVFSSERVGLLSRVKQWAAAYVTTRLLGCDYADNLLLVARKRSRPSCPP